MWTRAVRQLIFQKKKKEKNKSNLSSFNPDVNFYSTDCECATDTRCIRGFPRSSSVSAQCCFEFDQEKKFVNEDLAVLKSNRIIVLHIYFADK